MTEIKTKNVFAKEMKYATSTKARDLEVGKACIDSFFESTSYFRAIIIEQGADWFNIDYFGKYLSQKEKKAIMYKKFTELLIAHNTDNVFSATLLTDELTRGGYDIFFEKMEELFCTPDQHYSKNKKEPTIRPPIREVQSDEERYQLVQLTDLFIGCTLNRIASTTTNKNKNALAEYLQERVGIKFEREAWGRYSKANVELYHPKFNLWFWKPGSQ